MKRKIGVLVLSFLVIYLFNFSIPRLMPGDPFAYNSADASENVDTEMSREQKEYMRAYYGMDQPLHQQLLRTVKENLRGDFGQSIHYKRPAAEVIRERLPWTAFIMTTTLVLSLVIGVVLALWCIRSPRADRTVYGPAAEVIRERLPWTAFIMTTTLVLSLVIGVVLALWCIRSPRADRTVYGVCSFVSEIPSYLVGILLLFLVAARVKWIPLSGAVTAFARYDSTWQWMGDVLTHAFMPITAMCIFTIPKFYFTARASFQTVLSEPYMLSAKSRGLREWRIRWRYILVNGITPIVARLFLSVGSAIGSTMLIENVFAYPGLGTVMRESVQYRDYVMIQDIFLLSAVMVLVSLFVADLLNMAADRGEGNR